MKGKSENKKTGRIYLIRAFFISVIFSIVIFASYSLGMFYGVENFFEDILFSNKPVDNKIVIIAIDNESIEKIGQWPWPRSVFAEALNNLNNFEPSVVALDVIMSENSRFGAKDDNKFSEAIKKVKYPLVIPVEAKNLEIKNNLPPRSLNFLKPIFTVSADDNAKLAHVNLVADKDGIVRRFPAFIEGVNGEKYNSLSKETALLSGENNLESRELGEIERIVFSVPSGSVRKIPFWRLYENKLDKEQFAGNIIFIGSTAVDLHDEKQTPVDKGTAMSGVEIQAQITNMILKDYRLLDLSDRLLFIWIFFAFLIPFLIFFFTSNITLAIVANIVIGFLHIYFIASFFESGTIANFVHINMSWIFGTISSFVYRYLSVDKEKREMRNVFSKYVSKDVLEEILRNPSKVKLGGEERDATVFFSDVRSFTTLSEGMTPAQLTRFLNKYLTKMTNIVLENRGVVDKYIGDAIMAFWGAPVDNPDQSFDAVLSSLKMIDALNEFNKDAKKDGDPSIDIGIGLNFGSVTVGNMGSEVRFDYTVMGDTVNLASRLEGQTKTYGVKIIIGESVKNNLGPEKINKFGLLIREIDMIKVKGKNKPVTIFEVVPNSRKEIVYSIIDKFDNLRGLYYLGNFREGLLLAEDILKGVEDGPTKVLKERCLYFMEHTPEKWEGVYEMKSK